MIAASRPLIVIFAIILHMSWAIMLIFDRSVAGITALSIFDQFMFRGSSIVLLLSSAFLAAITLWVRSPSARAMMLLPQQFTLMLSAGGALVAMRIGHYADGTMRDHLFIIADQMHVPLLALLHAWIIVQIVNGKR